MIQRLYRSLRVRQYQYSIRIIMNEERHSHNGENIITTSRITYSCFQRVFCCRCFQCLQDEVLLTSDMRKQTLQKMIRNYVINEEEETLYDPIKLMILIYLCEDQQVPRRVIDRCRLNPSKAIDNYRTDLEFYIPQLCNFLVFHNDLKNSYLMDSVQKGCKLSFHFAHLYYFYVNSLEKTIGTHEIQVFRKVTDYRSKFVEEFSKLYEGQMLTSRVPAVPVRSDIGYMIRMYGCKAEDKIFEETVRAKDITLPNYCSIFIGQQVPELFSFKSTPNFFGDLFMISEELKSFENKKEKLKQLLQRVNARLPAGVYLPFSKDSNCHYNILNVVYQESKIFSTKSRAPFYICLEVYCPAEILSAEQENRFWEKVERPVTLKQNLYSESMMPRRYSDQRQKINSAKTKYRKNQSSLEEKYLQYSVQTEVFNEKDSHYLTNKLLEFNNEMGTQPRLSPHAHSIELKTISTKEVERKLGQIFGQTEEEMSERVRETSIFRGLDSWKLLHIIVKTGDNLKQEQFALQLIYQFDYIFKLEKLGLLLTPYEVLSMGPDCGIIQMVRDAVTFDKLKRHLRSDFDKPLTLRQFFELNFPNSLAQAKDTFMRSLAAYSLVMYFLQAKDRHNGNILLHRQGKIFHIDFGFFLSNLPGKGVQLEKDCPFKLLSEHIAVLDGPESYYFKKFRELLFQGFKAVRKHQNKILMLVKMMYSSSGTTMPCFEKGEQAIRQIQDRFNPQDVITDAQLNLHCQKLIDSSLDNWATKWYDRFQYFAQGIFY